MVTRAYFNEFVGVLIPDEAYEAPCMSMLTPVDAGSFICDELSEVEVNDILEHLGKHLHVGRIYYEVDGERRRVTYGPVTPFFEVALDCYVGDTTRDVRRALAALTEAGFDDPLPRALP